MSKHLFDTEVAMLVGIEKAIILENMSYWINKNIANGANFIDGEYWTYNSHEAFKSMFPYMKINTIKRCLRELSEDGIIITKNNISNNPYDKTNWYTIPKSSIVRNLTIDGQKNNHHDGEKSHHVHTNIKQYKQIDEKHLSLIDGLSMSIDDLKAIIDYRKSIKKPIKTQLGLTGLINKIVVCLNAGYSFDAVFTKMQEKEWQSVDIEWIKKEGMQTKSDTTGLKGWK